MDRVGEIDGGDGAGVGYDGSLFDAGDFAEIHRIGLGKDNGEMLQWGGDAGA